MKLKKIKHLTNKDIDKICKKYSTRDDKGFVHCNDCPLGFEHEYVCIKVDKAYVLKHIGNMYVEVEQCK